MIQIVSRMHCNPRTSWQNIPDSAKSGKKMLTILAATLNKLSVPERKVRSITESARFCSYDCCFLFFFFIKVCIKAVLSPERRKMNVSMCPRNMSIFFTAESILKIGILTTI